MSELRIHRRHLTQADLCRGESQAWLAQHGFDWIDFMRNGIPVSALVPYKNAFIERVITLAEKERDALNG